MTAAQQKQALKMYDAYDVDGREYRELAASLGMNTGELNQACWKIRHAQRKVADAAR